MTNASNFTLNIKLTKLMHGLFFSKIFMAMALNINHKMLICIIFLLWKQHERKNVFSSLVDEIL